MQEMVVNNPNIILDTPDFPGRDRRGVRAGRAVSEAEAAILRQIRQFRREIEETVCSATWAEDCLYRGENYSPDFRCACPVCRKLFPERLYPRAVRESKYSLDCQVETDEDPEFAEEFARLRNDRPRIGSVIIGRSLGGAS